MYQLVTTLFTIYTFMMIGYILLSWVPNAREGFIGVLLARVVEPYLSPFRKIIPPLGGMLDISPIIALIALRFIEMGVLGLLQMIGLL